MMLSALKILEDEALLRDHIGQFFEQYPGHRGQIRELGSQKRRSEYIHVVMEIGTPNIKVSCRQLSKLPKQYGKQGRSIHEAFRLALSGAETSGAEPVFFEFVAGDRTKAAVLCLQGRKLKGNRKAVEDLRALEGPRLEDDGANALPYLPEDLLRFIELTMKRVNALELHLARNCLKVPDGYEALVEATRRYDEQRAGAGMPVAIPSQSGPAGTASLDTQGSPHVHNCTHELIFSVRFMVSRTPFLDLHQVGAAHSANAETIRRAQSRERIYQRRRPPPRTYQITNILYGCQRLGRHKVSRGRRSEGAWSQICCLAPHS